MRAIELNSDLFSCPHSFAYGSTGLISTAVELAATTGDYRKIDVDSFGSRAGRNSFAKISRQENGGRRIRALLVTEQIDIAAANR